MRLHKSVREEDASPRRAYRFCLSVYTRRTYIYKYANASSLRSPRDSRRVAGSPFFSALIVWLLGAGAEIARSDNVLAALGFPAFVLSPP